MKITPLHHWNLSPAEAVQLQKQLAYEVVAEDRFDAPIKSGRVILHGGRSN